METYCDIVKAIGHGAEKPTHIMYKANLCWTVTKGCIRALESVGIVGTHENEGMKAYNLTEKGFAFLKQYQSVRESLQLGSEEA